MAKKNFDNELLTGAATFITKAQEAREAKAAAKAAERSNKEYRMNLKLDADLGEFIGDLHWRLRLSRNDVVASIIRAYKEAYEAQEKKE